MRHWAPLASVRPGPLNVHAEIIHAQSVFGSTSARQRATRHDRPLLMCISRDDEPGGGPSALGVVVIRMLVDPALCPSPARPAPTIPGLDLPSSPTSSARTGPDLPGCTPSEPPGRTPIPDRRGTAALGVQGRTRRQARLRAARTSKPPAHTAAEADVLGSSVRGFSPWGGGP